MSSPILCAKVFFACGCLFFLAGMITRQAALPSVDIMIHSTYFVIGHVRLLYLSGFTLWVYAGFYFVGARFLGLNVSPTLTVVHFLITTAGLIGLNSVSRLWSASVLDSGSAPAFRWVAVGYASLGLVLLGIGVFLVIFLLASGEQIRRIPA